MTYRPEIDGLRAIAVLSVIFFHSGFNFFSGGYIGVDIFFVISGYLITKIIVEELSRDNFSLKNFYIRRSRRILPALFFTVFLTMIMGLWIMDPADLLDLAKTILSVISFSSNIFLYFQDGYFDAAIEDNPLFHTWSLAVEEQYYLVIPLLLGFLWRFKTSLVFYAILVLTILSLLFAELIVRSDQMFAFFQLPTRFWELGVGSIISFMEFRGVAVKKQLKNFLSLLGLSLIFYSIIFFNKHSPVPGFLTLIPIIGTGLVIFSSKNTLTSKILSLKLFVGIGLISYSAYLIHQPIFAFVRIYRFGDMHPGIYYQAIIITLLLAFLCWKLIENPFRKKPPIDLKVFIKFISFSLLTLFASSVLIINTNGMESIYKKRLSEEEIIFFENAKQLNQNRNQIKQIKKPCLNPKEEDFSKCKERHGNPIIIFGDSHASNVMSALSFGDKYQFLIRRDGYHCHPYHLREKNSISTCDFLGLKKELSEKSNKFKALIFNQLGSYFIQTKNGDNLNHVDIDYIINGGSLSIDKERIKANLDYLDSLSEHLDVIWLASWVEPRYPLHSPRKAASYGLENINFHPEIIKKFNEIDAYAMNYIKEKNLQVHYVTLFDYEKGRNWINIFTNNCVTFNDKDHLSECGEKIATPYFESKLGAVLDKP